MQVPAIASGAPECIYGSDAVYSDLVSKHLIDLDEDKLAAARVELGTTTIRDTVNEALRLATSQRERRVADSLDVLAAADLGDREDAWR